MMIPIIGVTAFSFLGPLSLVIVAVLAILVFSYRQTIKAYPSAGGAYIVTRDNFGLLPAQVAGVALLTDYVLTVAVSTAAGVQAVTSLVPALFPFRLPLALMFVWLITYGNLLGVRESGAIFAAPTYVFIFSLFSMVFYGLYRQFLGGGLATIQYAPGQVPAPMTLGVQAASVFLILKAFASGGAALTGVEAISNGVPAFRKPEWKNAQRTMAVMGLVLGSSLLGVAYLGVHLQVIPDRGREQVGVGADRSGRVRQLGDRQAVLWGAADLDRVDPDPRGQHVVRRLPAAGELPRGRCLPPATVHEARTQARLLQRHPRARCRRQHPADRLQRERHRLDPALCPRRLHLVHPLPGRYGETPPEAAGRGMVPRAVDQRSRFDRHVHHPHRYRGGEVQPGRLDDHDRGSGASSDPRPCEPHLRVRGTRARRRAQRHRAWRDQATPRHRGGPGARREDGARDPVRVDGPAEAVHGGAGRSRPCSGRGLPARLDLQDLAHPARRHPVPAREAGTMPRGLRPA